MAAVEPTYTPITLGEAIVIARDRAGLTQEELAELVGVHYKTLGRWERSVTAAPPFAAVVRIARVTRQDLRWFVEAVGGGNQGQPLVVIRGGGSHALPGQRALPFLVSAA